MSEFDLRPLLERERPLLDRIFGKDAYRIESDRPSAASVRSGRFKLDLGYDARDRSIGGILTVTGPWGEEEAGPDGWTQFLGEKLPQPPRNASGHVMPSPEMQIRAELTCVARLCDEVFSDPQTTRDAVNFVRGYRRAYNDWARGDWNAD
jgi:hypothetical protein